MMPRVRSRVAPTRGNTSDSGRGLTAVDGSVETRREGCRNSAERCIAIASLCWPPNRIPGDPVSAPARFGCYAGRPPAIMWRQKRRGSPTLKFPPALC